MVDRVIGVPYNSAGPRTGVAAAPVVLAEAGLVPLTDLTLIDLPPGVAERGPSGLLAEHLLVEMIAKVADAVSGAIRAGTRPLVLGGDCPVLLGALVAGRELFGRMGLLFVDGHEDAWDPHRSPTGEAADSELGLALGHDPTGLPEPLAELVPLLDPAEVVILGARDADELAAHGQPSLAGTVELRRPNQLRDDGIAETTAGAIATIREALPIGSPWWLHVDLDVLATDQLAAVDYPQVGGLTWVELTALAGTALAEPDCRGWTLCIYNPDLDPDRDETRKIVDFVADVARCRP
jgi:arginase